MSNSNSHFVARQETLGEYIARRRAGKTRYEDVIRKVKEVSESLCDLTCDQRQEVLSLFKNELRVFGDPVKHEE